MRVIEHDIDATFALGRTPGPIDDHRIARFDDLATSSCTGSSIPIRIDRVAIGSVRKRGDRLSHRPFGPTYDFIGQWFKTLQSEFRHELQQSGRADIITCRLSMDITKYRLWSPEIAAIIWINW